MTLETKSISLLPKALGILESSFHALPEFEPTVNLEDLETVILEVATRMKDNYPYPHPYYIGQMLKPPHPIARLAYTLSLWINPNNHALDGGKASSAMEKDAVGSIGEMFGWTDCLGHLTSGGTMANLEALWISKLLGPGKTVVASDQAHYTHNRLCAVLDIPFRSVAADSNARMDLMALENVLKKENVGTVVATLGTTATGAFDPLPGILELQAKYGFRIHADAAYGGYFILAENLRQDTRSILDRIAEVDSIVVDPHKHGLQPYGCGCILFRDPSVGAHYKHDSPYTYFTSEELHLGEISLECSRPGSAAVALWATQKMLPMVKNGVFSRQLGTIRETALIIHDFLKNDSRFITTLDPELDIIVWGLKGSKASEVSAYSNRFFDLTARRGLHLAKANLPRTILENHWPNLEWDQEHVTCMRSCIMKPEVKDWIDDIRNIMVRAADETLVRNQSTDGKIL